MLYYPFGTLKKETSPTYIYSDTLNFQIVIGLEVAQNFFTIESTSYTNPTYNNNTKNFRWTYSDTSNSVTKGCLKVYLQNALSGETLYNQSCSTTSAATLLVGILNTSGATYEARAYYTISGLEQFIAAETHTFSEPNTTGEDGLLLVLFLTILFATSGYYDKTIALILAPLPILVGSIPAIGLIDLSFSIALALCVAAWIIAIWVSKRT